MRNPPEARFYSELEEHLPSFEIYQVQCGDRTTFSKRDRTAMPFLKLTVFLTNELPIFPYYGGGVATILYLYIYICKCTFSSFVSNAGDEPSQLAFTYILPNEIGSRL